MPPTPHSPDSLRRDPAFARAIGRTIKVMRTDLGIDRRTLAHTVGISYSYLTEIENGNKPPSSSVLGPLASALGLRMSELIEAAELRRDVEERELGPQALFDSRQPAPLAASYSDEPTPAFRGDPPGRVARSSAYGLRPSLRDANRGLRAALMELEGLLPALSRDDLERVLDLARRLAR